jgi:hypothetical protein
MYLILKFACRRIIALVLPMMVLKLLTIQLVILTNINNNHLLYFSSVTWQNILQTDNPEMVLRFLCHRKVDLRSRIGQIAVFL